MPLQSLQDTELKHNNAMPFNFCCSLSLSFRQGLVNALLRKTVQERQPLFQIWDVELGEPDLIAYQPFSASAPPRHPAPGDDPAEEPSPCQSESDRARRSTSSTALAHVEKRHSQMRRGLCICACHGIAVAQCILILASGPHLLIPVLCASGHILDTGLGGQQELNGEGQQ